MNISKFAHIVILSIMGGLYFCPEASFAAYGHRCFSHFNVNEEDAINEDRRELADKIQESYRPEYIVEKIPIAFHWASRGRINFLTRSNELPIRFIQKSNNYRERFGAGLYLSLSPFDSSDFGEDFVVAVFKRPLKLLSLRLRSSQIPTSKSTEFDVNNSWAHEQVVKGMNAIDAHGILYNRVSKGRSRRRSRFDNEPETWLVLNGTNNLPKMYRSKDFLHLLKNSLYENSEFADALRRYVIANKDALIKAYQKRDGEIFDGGEDETGFTAGPLQSELESIIKPLISKHSNETNYRIGRKLVDDKDWNEKLPEPWLAYGEPTFRAWSLAYQALADRAQAMRERVIEESRFRSKSELDEDVDISDSAYSALLKLNKLSYSFEGATYHSYLSFELAKMQNKKNKNQLVQLSQQKKWDEIIEIIGRPEGFREGNIYGRWRGLGPPHKDFLSLIKYDEITRDFKYLDPSKISDQVDSVLAQVFQFKMSQLSMNQNDRRELAIQKADQLRPLFAIHPFWDGNGRTIRLMQELVFLILDVPPPASYTNFELDMSSDEYRNDLRQRIQLF